MNKLPAYVAPDGTLFISTPFADTFSVYPSISDYNVRRITADFRKRQNISTDQLSTVFIDTDTLTIPSQVAEARPLPQFSFFKKPVKNTLPYKTVSLIQIYEIIKGEYFKAETLKAQQLYSGNKNIYRKFKAENFNYVTFAGTFKTRKDIDLTGHSGLIVLDLDHLEKLPETKQKLIADKILLPEMIFQSPGGNGLKVIVSIDISAGSHKDYFFALRNYVQKEYSLLIDEACKDVSRACFLSYDPHVYIKESWLE